jgi:hypothetical protein
MACNTLVAEGGIFEDRFNLITKQYHPVINVDEDEEPNA